MGKAGFVLHGARGKVGNLVARKGENKTILSEYQPVVRNPQTNAQMAQRIILSTVAQAIPLLYPIIDHSFEGFAVGSKCTREFRRLNMALLRQYAAIDFRDTPSAVDAGCFMTTKGVKALIPNKYQISSGSLASPKITVGRTDDSGSMLECIIPSLSFTGEVVSNKMKIKLGDALNQMFGISAPGEQLTFVVIQRSGDGYKYVFNGDESVLGWVIPYTSMRAARIVVGLNVDMNQEIELDVSNQSAVSLNNLYSAILGAFQASEKTDASLLTFVLANLYSADYDATFDGTKVEVSWESPRDLDDWTKNQATGYGHVYAAGIIRSKLLDNGNWAYSNTFMQLSLIGDGEANYGLDWNSAIQAWFEKDAITDNSLFLKEGATANELGESFT